VGESRLDKGFAFENEKEEKQKSKPLGSSRATASDVAQKTKINMISKAKEKAKVAEESEWTFGSFIRYLVLAAIIVALVVVIGGQVLQVGKSME